MTTLVVLVRGDDELATWPLTADANPGLSMVEELARLQLAARRMGCSIRLREACGELRELLDLAGLAEVVRCADGLVVEMAGEAEGGEEVGVEEAVERGDPID
jgi:hypothetical protein